jgi:uncharacterized protein
MIEIEELSDGEIVKLLERVGYGHLACSREDQPYVVPVHFAYIDGVIYIYTTEGKKSEFIGANPSVCLQAEDVIDDQHWQSVIVDGTAVRVTKEAERDKAFRMIVGINPTLTPAVSIHWLDDWVRENIEVIYRIQPKSMSGRQTAAPAN